VHCCCAAEGEHFTAGAQVQEVFGSLTEAEGEARIAEFLGLAHRTERLPFPTLAAVRGLCLAAGLETVLTLDLIWASDTAQFAFAEPIIGLTPIIGGAYRLAARAGTGRAIETVLTARPYPAARFAEWGVVNRVLPDAELDEKALAFAHRLAAGPTRAYDVTKQLLLTYREQGMAAADAITARACARLFETDDLAHGIESLLSKGPGQVTFRGR
jgi:enoyl-CoA hydratase/carnithine racemase